MGALKLLFLQDNYSVNAESNAENILFIESPALARAYRAHIGRLLRRYPPV